MSESDFPPYKIPPVEYCQDYLSGNSDFSRYLTWSNVTVLFIFVLFSHNVPFLPFLLSSNLNMLLIIFSEYVADRT